MVWAHEENGPWQTGSKICYNRRREDQGKYGKIGVHAIMRGLQEEGFKNRSAWKPVWGRRPEQLYMSRFILYILICQ